MEKPRNLSTYSTSKVVLSSLELVSSAAIFAVYFLTSGVCDTPIRLANIALALSLFTHALYTLFNMLVVSKCSEAASKFASDATLVGNVAMLAVLAAWGGISTYWIHTATSCSSDWFEGYAVTIMGLIVIYTILGLSICGSAIAGVFICIGSGLTTRADYKNLS